jgi:hypothetical protein
MKPVEMIVSIMAFMWLVVPLSANMCFRLYFRCREDAMKRLLAGEIRESTDIGKSLM